MPPKAVILAEIKKTCALRASAYPVSYPYFLGRVLCATWARDKHQLCGRLDRQGHACMVPTRVRSFALEAISDSLRREIAPLSVQVVVVQPAAVRTKIRD